MGGVCYFHVAMETCEGLVEKALEGANRVVDEGADDRKGGASHVAKAFLSANTKQVVTVMHVPAALKEKLSIEDWSARLMTVLGGEIVNKTDEVYTIVSPGNPAENKVGHACQEQWFD